MSNDSDMHELLQRIRRIETRITKLLKAQGVDPFSDTQKMLVIPGENPDIAGSNTAEITDTHITLAQIMAAMDEVQCDTVSIFMHGKIIAYVEV